MELEIERRDKFLLTEYGKLCNEIEINSKHEKLMEISAALGVSAIYAWLFAGNSIDNVGWWVPFNIAVLCALRQIGYRNRTLQISVYLREVESYFSHGAAVQGWEHRVEEIRKRRNDKRIKKDIKEKAEDKAMGWSKRIYWGSLTLFSGAIAITKTIDINFIVNDLFKF